MKNPMKAMTALFLVFAMSLSLLCGCGKAPSSTPDVSTPDVSSGGESAGFQSFEEIIDAVQTGISNEADEAYFADLGLNVGFSTYAQEMKGEVDEMDEPFRFGYALRDLDGDNVEELILGINFWEMPLILDVFGQTEEGVSLLISSEPHDRWYLGENNELYNFAETEEDTSRYGRYFMTEQKLVLDCAMFYDEKGDPEHPWCKSTVGFDPAEAERLEEEAAQELSDEMWPMDLDLTNFDMP